MLGDSPNRLLQPWLRFRYAEYVGTRLTRLEFLTKIPIFLLISGVAVILGILASYAVAEGDIPAALMFGGIGLTALLSAVTSLRMLIGYLRPDRYPVVLDLESYSGPVHWDEPPKSGFFRRTVLWSESGPDPADVAPQAPASRRISDAIAIVVLWFLAVAVWLVDLLLLAVFVIGDLGPGGATGGATGG